MTSAGVKKSYMQGARLTDEISYHKPNSGGVTVGIYGSKGSGKTTFLLTLAQTINCENPFSHNEEKETILWRGRSNDYWNWLPKEMVRIFIHKADFDRAVFKNDTLDIIPREELPPMEAYTSIRQLYSRLRIGKVNVVYWHASGESRLSLKLDPDKTRIFKQLGQEIPIIKSANGTIISVGDRNYLTTDLKREEVISAFRNAETLQ